MPPDARAPETGAVRTCRILGGVCIIVGLLGSLWGRSAGGPEVLSLWIGLAGSVLGLVFLVAYLVLRRRVPR